MTLVSDLQVSASIVIFYNSTCTTDNRTNGCEIDRLAYRSACRHANELINQSCIDNLRSKLEACTDPRQCWTVVKRLGLLHTDNGPAKRPSVTYDIGMCEQFADDCVSKIEQLRLNVA